MSIALLAAIISILSLDTTIAFQMLISSPLFSCTILGWLLGDVQLGIELGFLFQLLWLGRIPAGATVFPEGNVASMIATSLVLLNRKLGLPNTTLALIFLEGIFISYLGARMTVLYRKANGEIFKAVQNQVESNHFRAMLLLEAASILIYFILIFVFSYLIIYGNHFFLPQAISAVGAFFEEEFIIIKPVILGIGIAVVFPLLRDAIIKKVKEEN
jgi:mannose/fructose/N-acetylgalactosamine-specific phosphotransferase system component IIC